MEIIEVRRLQEGDVIRDPDVEDVLNASRRYDRLVTWVHRDHLPNQRKGRVHFTIGITPTTGHGYIFSARTKVLRIRRAKSSK